ncbi:MAG: hypothetical protein LBU64_02060 [Planctomycetota bacterium]|jgi:hypothetical protein|nr:hypothetical protein [Planctomycetota bacterium]
MKKRGLRPAWAFVILPILLASAAGAVEIPEGVQTNCARGEFGENQYVDLRLALVEEWLDVSGGGETAVAAVELEFRELQGGDRPEKIETAFMVMDGEYNQISPVLGGGVRDSGMAVFKWNGRDREGGPVPDGAYKVLMNIKGERYGSLLEGAVFPLNVVSAAPAVSEPRISSRKAVLEYGGAPTFTFVSAGVGMAILVDLDADGNEVSRWEGLMPPGKHTLESDLLNKDGKPYKPGKYLTRAVVANPLGESEALDFEYELAGPPPLEAAVTLKAPGSLAVKGDEAIPFIVTLNQPAYVELRHVGADGKTDLIGGSVSDEPAVLLGRGTHEYLWHRVDTAKFEFYETGTHWVRAAVKTLAGDEAILDSNRVALSPAPKPPEPRTPARPPAKPQPKRGIPNLKLTLAPEHVVIGGGRMIVKISYSLDQDSMIKVRIYDKRGKLVRTAVDSRNEHVGKGSYWKEIDVENYDYGSYKVVFEAINFHGERAASKHFSVGWR